MYILFFIYQFVFRLSICIPISTFLSISLIHAIHCNIKLCFSGGVLLFFYIPIIIKMTENLNIYLLASLMFHLGKYISWYLAHFSIGLFALSFCFWQSVYILNVLFVSCVHKKYHLSLYDYFLNLKMFLKMNIINFNIINYIFYIYGWSLLQDGKIIYIFF